MLGTTTRESWCSAQPTSHGHSTLPSGDGEQIHSEFSSSHAALSDMTSDLNQLGFALTRRLRNYQLFSASTEQVFHLRVTHRRQKLRRLLFTSTIVMINTLPVPCFEIGEHCLTWRFFILLTMQCTELCVRSRHVT